MKKKVMSEARKEIVRANVLAFVDMTISLRDHLLNVDLDARLYGWPASFVTELKTGLRKKYGKA